MLSPKNEEPGFQTDKKQYTLGKLPKGQGEMRWNDTCHVMLLH